MPDQNIQCRDCGTTFTFTDGEQAFYAERQLSAPQRCKGCRDARKATKRSGQRWPATCGKCSASCEVPFEPKEGGRPVLCDACFYANRQQQAA